MKVSLPAGKSSNSWQKQFPLLHYQLVQEGCTFIFKYHTMKCGAVRPFSNIITFVGTTCATFQALFVCAASRTNGKRVCTLIFFLRNNGKRATLLYLNSSLSRRTIHQSYRAQHTLSSTKHGTVIHHCIGKRGGGGAGTELVATLLTCS